MGFAAVALLHSWSAPSVLGVHDFDSDPGMDSVLAITLTSAVILVLRASHPPAGARPRCWSHWELQQLV